MAANLPWFRFYAEATTDRKIRRLSPSTRWLFVACLCAASTSPKRGALYVTADEPMTADDIADIAALSVKDTTKGLADLVAAGLLALEDDAYAVPAWDRRQYESDNSTTRVKRFRERSKAAPRHVAVTPPDTDTDTDTDTEVVEIGSLISSRSTRDPLENDPRWRRLADTMAERNELPANVYRTIRRLRDTEGIADHLLDAAAGQTIATDNVGLGYFTKIARDWYAQRTGS